MGDLVTDLLPGTLMMENEVTERAGGYIAVVDESINLCLRDAVLSASTIMEAQCVAAQGRMQER